ncbi:hypothetical protein ACH3O9_08845 [Leeuwenhoekiella sp. A16]|uniref:hypothetical protein n=1 Tax=unclassified Leeuwenhoekiella TaxID=2615029 RepID=UPI000C4E63CD|nr:hypothetical protein [Cytophagaceae bacterium]|tara:strand:- start:6661 stop:6900 length:240 start_codon:yes stop_codon:yes gene_type:complete
MKQEITLVSQHLFQLKKKYEMSHCTQCVIMKDYFKSEYERLKIRLKSLERLSVSNNIVDVETLAEANKTVGILGMYVMV